MAAVRRVSSGTVAPGSWATLAQDLMPQRVGGETIERFVIDYSDNAQSLTPALPMNLKLGVGLG